MSVDKTTKEDVLNDVGARVGSVTDLNDGSTRANARTPEVLAEVTRVIEAWNENNRSDPILIADVNSAIRRHAVDRLAQDRKEDPEDPKVRERIIDDTRYTVLSGLSSLSSRVFPK